MPDYKLAYVRVFVSDFERAIRFYGETVGMTIDQRFDEWRFCQFATGEGKLAIEASEPGEDNEETGPRFLAVSLQVEDILAVYGELLAKGVEFLGPPETMAWGGTLAHFKDPDGNVLTLLG
jgi:predicted enzyme related to lactoylglutathione lyase